LFYAGSRAFVGRTDFGTSTFNTPIVAGAFLSSAIANAYYPERERTLAFTLRSGGLNIGSAIGANLGREFWPDIKKLLLRK
jgi:hypothetical protein